MMGRRISYSRRQISDRRKDERKEEKKREGDGGGAGVGGLRRSTRPDVPGVIKHHGKAEEEGGEAEFWFKRSRSQNEDREEVNHFDKFRTLKHAHNCLIVEFIDPEHLTGGKYQESS